MTIRAQTDELAPAEIAALAAGCLLLDDARLYGLIDGGPDIDRQQCEQILDSLKRSGVVPSPDEAEAAALELMAELGALRP